ncbi:hypothetical protein DSM112329_01813 [Paraconexibacter sp. AEG42_29]|uniref:Guanylate cyclase domain-containing protein n=1 Tax=Paraconexibacter sp. AEG42_29 TaxID=2997339 RepID=A0AAU7ATI8_9ACTN
MPDDPAQPPERSALLDVLWAELGPTAPDAAADTRLTATRFFRTRRSRRRAGEAGDYELAPGVIALFELIAVEASDLQQLSPDIKEFLTAPGMADIDRASFPTVFQAYVRAIGRIAAAEAGVARAVMERTPVEDRPRVLADTIKRLLPISSRGFDVVHRVLLLDAVADELAGMDEPDTDPDTMAIAMVDLVGSTEYLKVNTPAELERLVDALFEAGQAATAHRHTHVLKYVGDGLFITGRDVGELAETALDVIDRLERELPLRARGGLAWGPVVQRAGDLFGLPINVAHIATKSAQPGMLLATAEAAARLPAASRGRYRTVELAHPALGATRVATVRRPAAPPATP